MKNFMIESVSKILKVIGNAKRLEIAFVLKDKEMKVGDLENFIGL
jgi:DNA-binding transcriptional ArsR family regulator